MRKISRIVFPFIESHYEWVKWRLFFFKNENRHNYICSQNKTRPIIILANGPSLKTYDLKEDDDSEYCTVNDAPLSSLFFKAQPLYHVMIDQDYYLKDMHEIRQKLNEVSWDMMLFVPFEHRIIADSLYGNNPHIKLVPVHCTGIPALIASSKRAFRLYDKGYAMPLAQNVLNAAIFIMIRLGYKQIELFGSDHSWLENITVNSDNQVCLVDKHFYNLDVDAKPWLNGDGTPYTMATILYTLSKAFASYEAIRKYADYLGDVRIVNKTRGSFIDAFDRQ